MNQSSALLRVTAGTNDHTGHNRDMNLPGCDIDSLVLTIRILIFLIAQQVKCH